MKFNAMPQYVAFLELRRYALISFIDVALPVMDFPFLTSSNSSNNNNNQMRLR